jgi:hypothetical protein
MHKQPQQQRTLTEQEIDWVSGGADAAKAPPCLPLRLTFLNIKLTETGS